MKKKNRREETRELLMRNKTKRKALRLYDELTTAKNMMMLFRIMLSTSAWTLAIMIIARFFMINAWYLSPIPLLFMTLGIIRMARVDALRKAEEKHKEFNEQLTTAKDNFFKENEMIEQLEEDIVMRSRLLTTSMYFERKQVLFSIIVICIMLFGTSYIAEYDVRDIPRLFEPVIDAAEQYFPRTLTWAQRVSVTGMEDAGDLESSDDIYGDRSEYIERTREIPIELQTARDALDLSSIREIEERDFDNYAPSDLRIAAAETYENTIPLEKYSVVRNYFMID
ncbi:MAG: hypothetical protein ACMXYL_00085 [Candidatus Woesearchaeota archaeon]